MTDDKDKGLSTESDSTVEITPPEDSKDSEPDDPQSNG
jgi:hypothetical protein